MVVHSLFNMLKLYFWSSLFKMTFYQTPSNCWLVDSFCPTNLTAILLRQFICFQVRFLHKPTKQWSERTTEHATSIIPWKYCFYLINRLFGTSRPLESRWCQHFTQCINTQWPQGSTYKWLIHGKYLPNHHQANCSMIHLTYLQFHQWRLLAAQTKFYTSQAQLFTHTAATYF